MIAYPALPNQHKPGKGQEPTSIQRRTLIGGALAALLSSNGRMMADPNEGSPDNFFILLLKGLYQPVGVGLRTAPDARSGCLSPSPFDVSRYPNSDGQMV